MAKIKPSYFISFFEKIPDDRWCVGHCDDGHGRMCAVGHIQNEEDSVFGALYRILKTPNKINDGKDIRYKQNTPKARIIAALIDAKNISTRKAQNPTI